MNCDYVRRYYQVPACIGRKIEFRGKKGIIVEDRGNYIGVTFDNEKPGCISNLHPTYRVKYLGMGKIRKMTRAQARYREYLDSECAISFAEWLGVDSDTMKIKRSLRG